LKEFAEVPEQKSCFSMIATDIPLKAQSQAAHAAKIPPPTINTS
jgi:hypothetical protein